MKLDGNRSPGPMVRKMWAKLSDLPGGKLLFSKAVGKAAPYTGTIGAEVLELRPGFARVQMRDKKKVRNHLNCVHAVALMNLAEATTGLAMTSGLPDGARGILKGLRIEYLKKARGLLVAECEAAVSESTERRELEIQGDIMNTDGEVVARAIATWLVGPAKG
ncbi:MAG: hotdog fold domain-containing protein [Myxococcota bacterium]